MALTDVAIRTAKIRSKTCRLADVSGLFLRFTPSGGRLWRWKDRHDRKEKLRSFGAYPVVTLALARARYIDARKPLEHEQGHDLCLVPTQYVQPFLKMNKNDYTDAEVIPEAGNRPPIRSVSNKSHEQSQNREMEACVATRPHGRKWTEPRRPS